MNSSTGMQASFVSTRQTRSRAMIEGMGMRDIDTPGRRAVTIDTDALGCRLNELGKRDAKRYQTLVSRESLLESQMIATLKIAPEKTTQEQMMLLIQNCKEKPFFKAFTESHGIDILHDLLSVCYHE